MKKNADDRIKALEGMIDFLLFPLMEVMANKVLAGSHTIKMAGWIIDRYNRAQSEDERQVLRKAYARLVSRYGQSAFRLGELPGEPSEPELTEEIFMR